MIERITNHLRRNGFECIRRLRSEQIGDVAGYDLYEVKCPFGPEVVRVAIETDDDGEGGRFLTLTLIAFNGNAIKAKATLDSNAGAAAILAIIDAWVKTQMPAEG